jgi:hypothetical protein
MSMFRRGALKAAALGLGTTLAAAPVCAQSINIGAQEVQVHGSIQQGFVVTDANNFLTMATTDGSGAMTDGAFNLSTNLTRKLRVGAQLYSRNIGDLGNGRPQVDWAFADYKFNDAVGVRAGKVKTPLGLFNDTQDMEFLYTWALLPQGVYPLDLRSVSIANVGGNAYGTIALKKAGSVQYSVYAGTIQHDAQGGYLYAVEDSGMRLESKVHHDGFGVDARWTTPVEGLMTGYSLSQSDANVDVFIPAYSLPLKVEIPVWRRQAVFGDYQRDRVRVSAEWRFDSQELELTPAVFPSSTTTSYGWFAAASYRLFKQLEVGSYHSRYVANTSLPSSADNNHINDTALTGRIDLSSFWNVKIEGHFMDGYGDPLNAHGFYTRSNQQGFDAKTNMLVVRTGVSF